uniref:Thiamin/hydroxymethyl pyrimidine-binding YkoF putative domain-containing protein n=1 Tax=Mantoniella antarctica TaxID=81844 RepID=A0A7S0SPB9_9CHLO
MAAANQNDEGCKFCGAQVSLYPMTDGFVDVIVSSLRALDPWRDRLRIETDDISTLIVGAPEVLFPALRDLYAAAATFGHHVVLRVTLSRGCPGEPDDAICRTGALANPSEPLASRQQTSLASLAAAPELGQVADAQFSLYVMSAGDHMAEIYGCIEFLKQSGTFNRSKNFCTRLTGDAGPVFATLREAFCQFGPPNGHVTIDLTVSAHSPSKR